MPKPLCEVSAFLLRTLCNMVESDTSLSTTNVFAVFLSTKRGFHTNFSNGALKLCISHLKKVNLTC